MRRVESDERRDAWLGLPAAGPAEALVAPVGEPEFESRLPRDHPAWPTDVASISRRARAVLERLRPIAIRVLSFWDHRLRSIAIAGRRLGVDVSGSYRLER